MPVLFEILDIITVHQVKKEKKYKTTSILLTLKIRHWKYEVYNTAACLWIISDKQSVYCFTAYAQSALLLVEYMTSDVDTTAWSVIAQSMIFWSNFCHNSTRHILMWLTSQMCVRYTRCSSTHTAKNCNKSMAEIKITLATKFQMAISLTVFWRLQHIRGITLFALCCKLHIFSDVS